MIGEAKSGSSMTSLTAFGAGENGISQLETNLGVVRARVEMDETIPEGVRASLLRQIDERSFETHLYLAPNTNVPTRHLDVYQEMLGRPLDAIYILPEAPPARD